MRNTIADFMEHDEALNQLPAFEAQKNATLHERKLTWTAYLHLLRQPKIIWADELVLLCASLMLCKEIIVVSTKQNGAPTCYVAAKRNVDWPFPYTTPPLTLGYLQDRHYESLHQIKSTIGSQSPIATTECQSSTQGPSTQSGGLPVKPSSGVVRQGSHGPSAPSGGHLGVTQKPSACSKGPPIMPSKGGVMHGPSTRSGGQPVAPSKSTTLRPTTSSGEQSKCKGCGESWRSLLQHLRGPCKQFYSEQDRQALKQKADDAHRLKDAQNKREKRTDPTFRQKENAGKRAAYDQNRENERTRKKTSYKQ